MPPEIAEVVYGIGILALFVLNWDEDSRASKALWLPVSWFLIAASRPLSAWLQGAPSNSADLYLDGSPLDRFVFTSLLAFGLVVLARRASRVTTLLRSHQAILLFFLYCGVSVLWSEYPDVAFRRWIKFIGNLVMVLIVLTDSEPLAAVKRLLARTGFLLVPISVFLVKYSPLGRTYTSGDRISSPWILNYTGVSDTKNGLGTVCMLFGIGALWHLSELLRESDRPHRLRRFVAHGAVLIQVLWLLSVAHSMTSLSCFLLGVVLIAVLSLPAAHRKSAAVHFVALTVVSVALMVIFFAPNLLVAIGRDPTLTGRTEIWQSVLGLSGNPLFGTGFESFWLGNRLQTIWNGYWWHPNEAHNGYIDIYLSLGWLGIALLAGVIVLGYRQVASAFHQNPAEGRLRLAYFVVALVYNVTESGFRIVDPVWILFLLVAMVPAEVSISDEEPVYIADHLDPFPDRTPILPTPLHPQVEQRTIETFR